jgi:hypothetical protein
MCLDQFINFVSLLRGAPTSSLAIRETDHGPEALDIIRCVLNIDVCPDLTIVHHETEIRVWDAMMIGTRGIAALCGPLCLSEGVGPKTLFDRDDAPPR